MVASSALLVGTSNFEGWTAGKRMIFEKVRFWPLVLSGLKGEAAVSNALRGVLFGTRPSSVMPHFMADADWEAGKASVTLARNAAVASSWNFMIAVEYVAY